MLIFEQSGLQLRISNYKTTALLLILKGLSLESYNGRKK